MILVIQQPFILHTINYQRTVHVVDTRAHIIITSSAFHSVHLRSIFTNSRVLQRLSFYAAR